MLNQNTKLQIAWQKYLELHAERDKLHAEGNKLRAEGDKLHAEGNKLRAEGEVLFYTAVINQYGKDAVVEFNEKGCQIESSKGVFNVDWEK